MKFLFLLLLIISACSTPKPQRPSRSDEYYALWSQDYYVETPAFQKQFNDYLSSVEEIFKAEDQMTKFETYISSTNNFFELMAHAEFNLPTLYKRLKGSRADLKTKMYEDFKNRNLSLQFDKLNKERSSKLKSDLGYHLFERIEANYHQKGFPTQTNPRFPM